MKKSLLLGLVAVMGFTAQAQQLTSVSTLSHPMKRQGVTLSERAEKASFAAKKGKKVAAKADQPLLDQPAGKLFENMYVTSESYGLGWGDVYYQPVDGGYGAVVEGDDGCLYVKGPLSQAYVWGLGYPWIKLEKGEGDAYVMSMPQPYAIDYGDLYYIERLKYDEDLESYVSDEDNQSVRFQWKDNVLTQLDDAVVGLCDATHDWFYMGDWDIKYVVNNDKVAQVPSQGFEPFDMRMDFKDDPKDLSSEDKLMLTSFASGDETARQAYFAGFEANLPDAPVIYQINEDTHQIEIPGGQYMGVDMEYSSHMYLLSGNAKVENSGSQVYFNYDLTDKLALTVDEQTEVIAAAYPASLVVNCGRNQLYIADEFVAPRFSAVESKAQTPADPKDFTVKESVNFDIVKFVIPDVDVEGEDLNTKKLFYNIYLDNQVYTFDPEVFVGLDAPMTDVPYGFSESEYDIYMSASSKVNTIYFYDNDYKTIGVQSVYRGGSEERRSAIVSYTRSTTGINGINADVRTVKSESYYNVAGQRVDASASGLIIKKVEFTNGTTETYKVVK